MKAPLFVVSQHLMMYP